MLLRALRVFTCAVVLLSFVAVPASAATIVIDVTGAEGWGSLGDPSNTVLLVDIAAELACPGCAIVIDSIGWDVDITPYGTSWYSEARVQFSDSAQSSSFVNLTPGVIDSFADSGVSRSYSSGGLVYLPGLSIPVIELLGDGILRLEFHESYVDSASPDSVWSGTISVNAVATPVPVPEPATLLLLGTGLAVAARRRLRKRT